MLSANAELDDQGLVPFLVVPPQIVKETPTATDHRQQSSARVMVLFVALKMLCEVRDAVR
jgi:hypothetical protein